LHENASRRSLPGRRTASSSTIVSPFGDSVTSGPFTVNVAPNAVFQNQAGTSNSFFTLFNTMPSNNMLGVFVRGVGSGTTNGITAFQVESATH
jgi:hypothetical protein